MAVDALQLRPRGAVALFDAAVRLCATSAGVWALTLPAGAGLLAALFHLVESLRLGSPLALPVALWTAAWLFRALSQGAACHYVDQQLLGTSPASTRLAVRAALRRAPGLVVAATWTTALDVALWVFTLGVGHLFMSAHLVGLAATMRGRGSVLRLPATCHRLLGPTAAITPWVRLCGLSQLVLGLNLHLATSGLLSALHALLGFDVTFLQRFATLANPTWLVTLAAATFALFEPVRAAVAALLLVDARVRQEGLDLLAQVEQLPRRRRARAAMQVATLLVLAWPLAATANGTALQARALEVATACGAHEVLDLSPLATVAAADQSGLARLLRRVEHLAWEEDDCGAAAAALQEGLALYAEARAAPAPPGDPREAAARILARPEFQHAQSPSPSPDEPPEPSPPGALERLWERLWRALLDWLQRDRSRPAPQLTPPPGADMAGANVIAVVTLAIVAGVLAALLLRGRARRPSPDAALAQAPGLRETPLADGMESALSRPAETWAGLADELAGRGQHREAIRHLYLALLSRLHRDGAIDYEPTRSNWDYLFAFKGSAATRSIFRELTRRFDFTWYGNLGADAPAWQRFRELARPVLAPPEEATGRA